LIASTYQTYRNSEDISDALDASQD
jgi:hypothetical protein